MEPVVLSVKAFCCHTSQSLGFAFPQNACLYHRTAMEISTAKLHCGVSQRSEDFAASNETLNSICETFRGQTASIFTMPYSTALVPGNLREAQEWRRYFSLWKQEGYVDCRTITDSAQKPSSI